MLQAPRSASSKSFLREAKDALLIIKDEKVRNYFLKKLHEVVKNRANPDKSLTGEKALKEQILAYLKQQGEIKTANIWARNIDISLPKIEEFKKELTKEMYLYDCNGIVEIHLQDREINSPHIQYVGTNAEIAQAAIAILLVNKKYELSVESALGKKDFTPYYQINNSAFTRSLEQEVLISEEMKARIEYKKEKNLFQLNSKETIKKLKDKKDNLFDFIDEKISSLKTNVHEKKITRLKHKGNIQQRIKRFRKKYKRK